MAATRKEERLSAVSVGEIAKISEEAESIRSSGLKMKFPEVKLPVSVSEKLSASPSSTSSSSSTSASTSPSS